MRIQHNIMAMNAYRNYNINTSALSKNLEKLSSGYKINRAGDDAAGLAISEKMRAQITGLNAATKNVKDGISLVKTAEGAMQEIQDMLNRMDYLATQSANGTYDNEVDRANLQKEVDALKTEINRIADSANFNGIKLLDGTQQGTETAMTNIGKGAAGLFLTPMADASPSNGGAQKGIYSIDLKDFKASVSTSGTGVIGIQVSGVTVASYTVSSTGGSALGSDFRAIATQVSIASTSFNVRIDTTNSKIILEMANPPADEFTAQLTVDVAGATGKPYGGTNGAGTDGEGNTAHTLSVVVDQEARPDIPRVYAQAQFTLGQDNITDGFQLKIGKQTYTFAVGKNSQFKNAANVVDMTDWEAGQAGIEKAASRRLSTAAQNNTMFKVSTPNDSGVVNITEKEGAGIDYTVNNLVGNDKSKDHKQHTADDWAGLLQYGKAASGTGSGGLTLQIGDTADSYNQLSVKVGDMHTKAMGIANVNISSQTDAQAAIAQVRDAINYVSGIRGDLGAVQNRLEHTQNNLSVMAENIQDAESTIRDTDVAEEMMSYVKNNILVQSAQAMLAQANQVPQGVLQLLG